MYPVAPSICRQCEFYDPWDDKRTEGICRRMPSLARFTRDDYEPQSFWPKVDGLDWCGKFRPDPKLP